MDAIRWLLAEHRAIEALFFEWERMTGPLEGIGAVEKLIQRLEQHMRLLEGTFFPALAAPLGESGVALHESVLPLIREEHHMLGLLLCDLACSEVAPERLAARIDLLGSMVRRHFNEEEYSLFPIVRMALSYEALDELGDALVKQEAQEAQRLSSLRLTWLPEAVHASSYEPGP
jgi:iron-sulfur cluster repair protein YtfE (RIC family)